MNTNAAHQIPVHRQRRRISRQEMLRRKRAIRRRKRIARFFRISVAVLLLLTAVSFGRITVARFCPPSIICTTS